MTMATLTVSLDGGTPVTGGQAATIGQIIQLGATNKYGWEKALWQVFGPPDWDAPAGWTDLGDGCIEYLGALEDPPAFVGDVWGKFYLSIQVNDGKVELEGDVLEDDATMIDIPSPNGFHDLAVFETNQFSALRQWVRPLQIALRAIDAFVTGGGVAFSGDLDPSTSSSTAQYVRKLTGTGGVLALASTAAVIRWAANATNVGRAQLKSTSGAGTPMQDRTQAAQGSSGASAGDMRVILGKSDGAAARPFWRLAYETVAEGAFTDVLAAQFDGTRGVLQSVGNAVALRLATAVNGDVELAPHGTGAISLLGRTRFQQRIVASNMTLDTGSADLLLWVDLTAPRTVTLPAPTAGRVLWFKDQKALAHTNALTLARAGSEKIEGIAASLVLTARGGAWVLIGDGTDWHVWR